MAGLSWKAKIFFAMVSIIGWAALCVQIADWESDNLLRFSLYLVVFLIASGMKVWLPGITGTMSVNYVFVLLAVGLTGPGHVTEAQSGDEFVVIVNAKNPAQQIHKSDLSRFLLKKKSKWDFGARAEPADLTDETIRTSFCESVHGRSLASIKTYWQRQVFSGRAVPPPEVDSNEAMVEHVAATDGAVGYVAPGTRLGDGVKVVELLDD